ncbi:28S ribosomal protein S14, mitochondrial-like [Acanthaster planci]|uniref:28S ribosomal protein S14, mitochondrial n=1 Tax=Acanthaster planci TaxID=133434 RepID=A0A8B7YB61_ACAPL|nr:28S ribosomal protein S14, mitochondrial-like [Acanthaster planci]
MVSMSWLKVGRSVTGFLMGDSHKASLLPMASMLTQLGRAPSRTYYTDWRMLRDVKRRRLFKEYGVERRRINCIRKNTILPDELKEIADREIAALPRDSCWVRQRGRCAITSRPRSVLPRWRLSRIVWRQVADANHMSGVQRSSW